MRLVALAAVAMGIGTTLVLAEIPWFHRLPLVDRLRPFASGGVRSGRIRSGPTQSFRDVLVPLASGIGGQLSRSLGIDDDLTLRLARVHSSDDPTAFRIRQVGWATGGLVAAVSTVLALDLPVPMVLLVLVALPLLGFLVPEQQLSSACDDHRRRLFLELPIVTEQFGMLLSAGYSLTGALTRIAERGRGACALDVRRAVGRIRQGIAPVAALNEWARIADVDALHRLVGVLGLHEDASDLGRLISNEARSMRRELHRELLERIERRSQQVWIPVTVAALVPGVIFLAIPFTSALRSFGTL
jgi:tight adherence protein C